MTTPLRTALSHAVGWLADRRIPRPLRAPIFEAYARFTGADLSEALPPLHAHASLGAFFVRRLRPGARPLCADPELVPSPVDGRVQTLCRAREGTVLQAKGRSYALRDLLAGVGGDLDLEGAAVWTIYLSPRDYHRIHSPEEGVLTEVRRVGGCRFSVAPKVLARRDVLAVNERAVLRIETARGPLLLVLVGALNVGRIRVVGVPADHDGPLETPRELERGGELARFEMGSTIVLVAPGGVAEPLDALAEGQAVLMGEAVGRYLP
ncbi:MAG: archaetidylserine decarboxylase [Planctomycetota bacterium]|nr:archaetidylserine decarboxylase [Planctomycetota bacterium]MDP6762401.1 archaetidylserine decarboxylase [Planctomycetota bacterium]MDP6988717.1 archaetidylserine decarboxylase [Planctomycetota bacterium]